MVHGLRSRDGRSDLSGGVIRGAQRLGLKLRDIHEFLTISDRGVCPCGHTARPVNRRLADLDAQIVSLQRLRREMGRLLESLPSDSVGATSPGLATFGSFVPDEVKLMAKGPCPNCGCPCGESPCPCCGC